MSTPMCRSWCRRSSAGRLSPSGNQFCQRVHRRAGGRRSWPGKLQCRSKSSVSTAVALVVIIGSVGAAVIWWIRRNLPESPRWLAEQHGRAAEAEAIVADLENKIRADGGGAGAAGKRGGRRGRARKSGAWMEMWSEAYRGRTVMLIVYNLFQTVGYYGFSSWVPTLLISQGVSVTKSLTYTFIIAVAAPVGPLVGVFFADRFERKWQIAWAAAGIAAFGLLFAQQSTAAGVIVCGLLITLCNNWMSFSFHAYQAELYPTRIRARAQSASPSIRGAGFPPSSPASSSRSSWAITAPQACSASLPAPWRWCSW